MKTQALKTLASSLVISIALIAGSQAIAKTDNELLADCKAQVLAEYGSVERVKVANINSKRNLFKAKLKVRANGEKSLYACEIRGEAPVEVACLKGACDAGKVAVN